MRGDIATDHSKLSLELKDLPTSIIIFGSFELGSTESSQTDFDDADNLDFMSKI